MKQPMLVATLAVLTLLTGCNSMPIDQKALAAVAASSETSKSVSNTTELPKEQSAAPNVFTDKNFQDLLANEFKNCEEKAESLGIESHKAKSLNIGIATFGIVAGSIVVPSLAASGAAKSAIAAWGGVSGAANAAQLSLNANGQSALATVRAQQAFVTNVQKVVDRLKTLKSGQEAAAFIYELRFACSIGVPIPDVAAMPTLSTAGAPSKQPGAQESTDTAK